MTGRSRSEQRRLDRTPESEADRVERVLGKYIAADPDGYEASVVRRHREREAHKTATDDVSEDNIVPARTWPFAGQPGRKWPDA